MLQFLMKGGWLMVPLVFCSILSLTIIIEKFLSLGVIGRKANSFIEKAKKILNSNDDRKIDKLTALCEMTSSPPSRIFRKAIEKRDKTRDEIKEAIEDAGSLEVPYLEKHLRILGTIATIAPLLGLLGTVFGMIKAFNVIAIQGVGEAGALAGGIAEALITTAVGLSIAIPTLVFYNYFTHHTDKLVRIFEDASGKFLELLSS
ncbi:MAG: MotA/TolQ/ExbB proton channel family protein [Candidatus Aerophobetes bacterium]|nr:MotA/TolQ/ExbB proton channel family protein [Candidatus Aerophobetes bacterium]